MASTSYGSEENGRHGWNSLDGYQPIHENRLNNHTFLDGNRPHTVAFEFYEFEGALFVRISGQIYCQGGIVVEVEKYLETEEADNGQIFVRGFSYRYHAFLPGQHNILRYDNQHGFEEYHRHLYDINTGEELESGIITRNESPTLGEILDQLEALYWNSQRPEL